MYIIFFIINNDSELRNTEMINFNNESIVNLKK